MHKDFDRWNKVKKAIETNSKNKNVHDGRFYWCTIGLNIGSEENGKDLFFRRPIFLFKKIDYFKCLVIPLTTSSRKYKNKKRLGFIKGRKNFMLLDQIRIIDTKRILNEIISHESQSRKATKTVLEFLDGLRKSL